MSSESAKEDAKRTIANAFKNMKLRDSDLKRTNIIPSSNENDQKSTKSKLKKSNSDVTRPTKNSSPCGQVYKAQHLTTATTSGSSTPACTSGRQSPAIPGLSESSVRHLVCRLQSSTSNGSTTTTTPPIGAVPPPPSAREIAASLANSARKSRPVLSATSSPYSGRSTPNTVLAATPSEPSGGGVSDDKKYKHTTLDISSKPDIQSPKPFNSPAPSSPKPRPSPTNAAFTPSPCKPASQRCSPAKYGGGDVGPNLPAPVPIHTTPPPRVLPKPLGPKLPGQPLSGPRDERAALSASRLRTPAKETTQRSFTSPHHARPSAQTTPPGTPPPPKISPKPKIAATKSTTPKSGRKHPPVVQRSNAVLYADEQRPLSSSEVSGSPLPDSTRHHVNNDFDAASAPISIARSSGVQSRMKVSQTSVSATTTTTTFNSPPTSYIPSIKPSAMSKLISNSNIRENNCLSVPSSYPIDDVTSLDGQKTSSERSSRSRDKTNSDHRRSISANSCLHNIPLSLPKPVPLPKHFRPFMKPVPQPTSPDSALTTGHNHDSTGQTSCSPRLDNVASKAALRSDHRDNDRGKNAANTSNTTVTAVTAIPDRDDVYLSVVSSSTTTSNSSITTTISTTTSLSANSTSTNTISDASAISASTTSITSSHRSPASLVVGANPLDAPRVHAAETARERLEMEFMLARNSMEISDLEDLDLSVEMDDTPYTSPAARMSRAGRVADPQGSISSPACRTSGSSSADGTSPASRTGKVCRGEGENHHHHNHQSHHLHHGALHRDDTTTTSTSANLDNSLKEENDEDISCSCSCTSSNSSGGEEIHDSSLTLTTTSTGKTPTTTATTTAATTTTPPTPSSKPRLVRKKRIRRRTRDTSNANAQKCVANTGVNPYTADHDNAETLTPPSFMAPPPPPPHRQCGSPASSSPPPQLPQKNYNTKTNTTRSSTSSSAGFASRPESFTLSSNSASISTSNSVSISSSNLTSTTASANSQNTVGENYDVKIETATSTSTSTSTDAVSESEGADSELSDAILYENLNNNNELDQPIKCLYENLNNNNELDQPIKWCPSLDSQVPVSGKALRKKTRIYERISGDESDENDDSEPVYMSVKELAEKSQDESSDDSESQADDENEEDREGTMAGGEPGETKKEKDVKVVKKKKMTMTKKHMTDRINKMNKKLMSAHAETNDQSEACIEGNNSGVDDDDENEDSKRPTPEVKPVRTKEQKILSIFRELVYNERIYVSRLVLIEDYFHAPLLEKYASSPPGDAINKTSISRVFSGLNCIRVFHQDNLLPSLEKRLEEWEENPKFGDIFHKCVDFMKIYYQYICTCDESQQNIIEWRKTNDVFDKFMKSIEVNPICDRLSLIHHMLAPIQQVPRYELELKNYLKNLTEESEDYKHTKESLQKILEINKTNNEASTIQKNFSRKMQLKFFPMVDMSSNHRKLVKEGKIFKVSQRNGNIRSRYLFLFTDILMLCDEGYISSDYYKMKTLMELNTVDVIQGNNDETQYTFLIRSDHASLELHCPTDDLKTEWMQAILAECKATRKAMETMIPVLPNKNRYSTVNGGKAAGDSFGSTPPTWVKDQDSSMCMLCGVSFRIFSKRRHHCRACGNVICEKCSPKSVWKPLIYKGDGKPQRICKQCFNLSLDDDQAAHKEDLKSTPKSKKPSSLQVCTGDPSFCNGYLDIWHEKKAWRHQFFIISKDFAMYAFKAKQDVTALFSIALPGHTVETLSVEEAPQRKPFVIRVMSTKKTYILQCEDQATLDKWVYYLECAITATVPSSNNQRKVTSTSVEASD